MITRSLIKNGLENNNITLIDSPTHDGTVAKIGKEWFYFGGSKALAPPEKYIRMTSTEEITEALLDALDDIRKDHQVIRFSDIETITKYGYYELVLNGIIETEIASAGSVIIASNISATPCDDDGFQRVVAKTADGETVVAILDTYTERTVYLHPLAKYSVPVQKLLAECMGKNRKPVAVRFAVYSRLPFLQISTGIGDFTAMIVPKEFSDDEGRLYIGFEPAKGTLRAEQTDLARIKITSEGIKLTMRPNLFNENDTMDAEMTSKDVADFLEQYWSDED